MLDCRTAFKTKIHPQEQQELLRSTANKQQCPRLQEAGLGLAVTPVVHVRVLEALASSVCHPLHNKGASTVDNTLSRTCCPRQSP